MSFVSNGVAHSNSFSAILSTTRNPDLDGLAKGRSLGTTDLGKDFGGAKLKYGVIYPGSMSDDQKQIGHVAFGLDSNVSLLKKGGLYI
jgi:hypothetical protein